MSENKDDRPIITTDKRVNDEAYKCPMCGKNTLYRYHTEFSCDAVPMRDKSTKPITVPIIADVCESCGESSYDHVASTAIENAVLRMNVEHDMHGELRYTWAIVCSVEEVVSKVNTTQEDMEGKLTGWLHQRTFPISQNKFLVVFHKRKNWDAQ